MTKIDAVQTRHVSKPLTRRRRKTSENNLSSHCSCKSALGVCSACVGTLVKAHNSEANHFNVSTTATLLMTLYIARIQLLETPGAQTSVRPARCSQRHMLHCSSYDATFVCCNPSTCDMRPPGQTLFVFHTHTFDSADVPDIQNTETCLIVFLSLNAYDMHPHANTGNEFLHMHRSFAYTTRTRMLTAITQLNKSTLVGCSACRASTNDRNQAMCYLPMQHLQ